MTPSAIAFWCVALVTAAAAVLAAIARNLAHAILSLCVSLLGIAGLYLFLRSGLLAAAQVAVQAGGVTLLLMLASTLSPKIRDSCAGKPAAAAAGGLAASLMLLALFGTIGALLGPLSAIAAAGGGEASVISVAEIGSLLLGAYMAPFEAAGVALTAALVGAAMLARKETR